MPTSSKKRTVPTKEEVDKAFEEFKKSIDEDEEYKKKLKDLGIDETYLKSHKNKS